MDFGLSDEQKMIVDTVRNFVEKEIYPFESEVEATGVVPVSYTHLTLPTRDVV